jgi:putative transposase
MIDLLTYYRFQNPPLKYSLYNRLQPHAKQEALRRLAMLPQLIEIYAFSIMPNHFHLVVKELIDDGISTFLRNSQNGYAKYYNTKNKRPGALFQAMFKCVEITTDDLFLHVTRYVHLNPLTAGIVSSEGELEKYPWSSYYYYVRQLEHSMLSKENLLNQFNSVESFKQFTLDNAQYQQTLADIHHLLNEDASFNHTPGV